MKGKTLTYKRYLVSLLVVASIAASGCALTSKKNPSSGDVKAEAVSATAADAVQDQAAPVDVGLSKLVQPDESEMRASIDPEAMKSDVSVGADVKAHGQVDSPGDINPGDRLATASQVTLRAMNFTSDASEANSLVVELSNPAKVELKRTAPSEYVVRIKQAISDNLQPLMSSSQSNFIRSARVTTDGPDQLIRLFTNDKAELLTQQDGNKIVITGRRMLEQGIGAADITDSAQFAPSPEGVNNDSAPQSGDESPTSPTAGNQLLPVGAGEKSGVTISEGQATGAAGTQYYGRLISLDLQDTDIDNALRIIAEVSNLNIIASEEVTGKVTLRLIDVPWDQALDVILKTNGLDKVAEGNVVRIAPVDRLRQEREGLKQARDAEEELEPLTVKYLRVSYSKASELKQLVDGVLTERGNVAFDERTNQLIVKDIRKGVENAEELIKRLDLRTPQVLLETQIVESNRNLLRDIGAEFGYRYIQSPEIGNSTGKNFPNSVDLGFRTSNPAGGGLNPISLVLGSADGSKSLSAILTQAEADGRGRVVSRPSVATINNKPASIRSIERVRIRLPAGGVSVATGQGANAAGQGTLAAESIEVGIVLEVTPQASPDYYVLMDINAKSSTLGTNSVDGVPNEIERSATSSVLVSSGQTFALGGIYKLSETSTNTGVPFFKDIPIIGQLFRRTESRGSDEELLFFITPRIVEGSFDEGAMKSSF